MLPNSSISFRILREQPSTEACRLPTAFPSMVIVCSSYRTVVTVVVDHTSKRLHILTSVQAMIVAPNIVPLLRYDYSAYSPAVKETFSLSLREADLASWPLSCARDGFGAGRPGGCLVSSELHFICRAYELLMCGKAPGLRSAFIAGDLLRDLR